MTVNILDALTRELGGRDFAGELVGELDDEVRDVVEWAGTYDVDELLEKALEYVDGSAATIYDDDAYAVCSDDPALADELARALLDVDGWRSLPLNRLTTLACYMLEHDLRRQVEQARYEIEAIADVVEFADEVVSDDWGVYCIEAEEEDARAVCADVLSSLSDGDVIAARAAMDALADSADENGKLDMEEYRGNL